MLHVKSTLSLRCTKVHIAFLNIQIIYDHLLDKSKKRKEINRIKVYLDGFLFF